MNPRPIWGITTSKDANGKSLVEGIARTQPVAAHRFVEEGLRLIQMRSSPKFYSFVAQVVGTPELSRGQLERLHHLGAKVGLSRREVHAALAAQAEPRKRRLPGWLLALVVTFAVIATLAFGVYAVVYLGYRTYIPGTLYSGLSPDDFD